MNNTDSNDPTLIGPSACTRCGGEYGEHEKWCNLNTDSDEQQDDALLCEWCAKGDGPNFLDSDGTLVSITGRDGILCHAHEEYWWPCLKFGVEFHCSRASIPAVEGESDYDYAVRLARHLMTSRFPVEGWEPLPTLSGVLSQIDNMIAGLTKPKLTMRDLALRHTEQGLRAAASSPAPAQPTPEQLVYNVAQRDPRFRKHLIKQLTALGDEQDKGPLRTLTAPAQPEGEQEKIK